MNNIFLIIFILIIIAFLLFFYKHVSLKKEGMENNNNDCEEEEDENKQKEDTSTGSNNDYQKGTLFLYPESGGFNVKDFGGFPPVNIVKESFNTIAVIANHASGDEGIKKQFNDPDLLKLKQESGLPLVHWMAYYFGYDSTLFCDCNIKGCKLKGTPQDCEKCKQALLTQMHKDVQTYNLTGILFDDEVGDPLMYCRGDGVY